MCSRGGRRTLGRGIFLGVLLWGCHVAWGARLVRERVVLKEARGEASPRGDAMEFDPLLAELEQEQDDRKWMEGYRRAHHMWTSGSEDGAEEGLTREGAEDRLAEALSEMGTDLGEELEDLAEQGEALGEDFLYEDFFNITDRIITLFPRIDVNPVDARLSLQELVTWHVQLAEQGIAHRTRRELEAADADGDGSATLQEALAGMGVGDPRDEATKDHREALTDRFHVADADKDGLLSFDEFNEFLHPEESGKEELWQSLVREEMRHRDLDGDGKLNVNEFEMTTHHELATHGKSDDDDDDLDSLVHPAWRPGGAMAVKDKEHARALAEAEVELLGDQSGVSREQHQPHPKHLKSVQDAFASLDVSKDGFIDTDELKPVIKKLWPSQRHFAHDHAKDIIQQADFSQDGHLTLDEMLAHPHVFYQTVEDHEKAPSHDEF